MHKLFITLIVTIVGGISYTQSSYAEEVPPRKGSQNTSEITFSMGYGLVDCIDGCRDEKYVGQSVRLNWAYRLSGSGSTLGSAIPTKAPQKRLSIFSFGVDAHLSRFTRKYYYDIVEAYVDETEVTSNSIYAMAHLNLDFWRISFVTGLGFGLRNEIVEERGEEVATYITGNAKVSAALTIEGPKNIEGGIFFDTSAPLLGGQQKHNSGIFTTLGYMISFKN